MKHWKRHAAWVGVLGLSASLLAARLEAGEVATAAGEEKVTLKRTGVEPSAEEQWFIYLLNKARHDPAAYGRTIRVDLAHIPSAPPLAPNKELSASARFRGEDMLKRRYFGHVDPDGVGPDRHAQESGYALAGGISRQKSANTIESISLQAFKADGFLAQLVTDPNSPSKGHRMHLLGVGGFYAQARDIGVGLTRSGNVKAPGREFQPAFCVLHTGRTGSETAWVTGVAYADKNRNGAYDPGEGLEGVEVKGGERLVRSLKEGGYALPVPLVGELEITCEMGALHGYAKAKLALEGKNIHVEFLARKPEGVVNFGPAVAPAKKKE